VPTTSYRLPNHINMFGCEGGWALPDALSLYILRIIDLGSRSRGAKSIEIHMDLHLIEKVHCPYAS
jgi:hypothetical protein